MNEEKKVPFKWEYGEETISLQLGMYANNQRLYIGMITHNRNHCLKWSKAVWRQTVLPISRESIRYLWLECSLWRAD